MGSCASSPGSNEEQAAPVSPNPAASTSYGDSEKVALQAQNCVLEFKADHHNESLGPSTLTGLKTREGSMDSCVSDRTPGGATSPGDTVMRDGRSVLHDLGAVGAVTGLVQVLPRLQVKTPRNAKKRRDEAVSTVPGAAPSSPHASFPRGQVGMTNSEAMLPRAPAPSMDGILNALTRTSDSPEAGAAATAALAAALSSDVPQEEPEVVPPSPLLSKPGANGPEKLGQRDSNRSPSRRRTGGVTFDASVVDSPRGLVRNKSRLRASSNVGIEDQAWDNQSIATDTERDILNSGGSIKSCPQRSISPHEASVSPTTPHTGRRGHHTRAHVKHPMPQLPPAQHTNLPAAKGGASEPGLWVLRRTGSVHAKYIMGEDLGKGQFGSVCVAIERASGTKWACKSLVKRRVQGMHDFSMADVLREVEVLYTVGGHPGVVGLHEVYEDEEDLHLILELCTGGDWFERLINFGRYTEAEAASTIRAVLEALSYCHSLGVMHRDIKPENIMFVERADNSSIKLTDFGLAAMYTDSECLSEVLGSAYYVAPEVLREKYSKEADIWSAGVVLFIALGGYAPFDGSNEREVFSKILHEALSFNTSSWTHISADAKEVIAMMLTKDPLHRATIKALLEHRWFATCAGTITPVLRSPHVSVSVPKAQAAAIASTLASTMQLADGPRGVMMNPALETARVRRNSIAAAVVVALSKGKEIKAVPDAVVARLQQFSAMNAFKRQARRVLAQMLPEEEVVGLLHLFKSMDTDGDGVLSVRELQAGLEARGVCLDDRNAKALLEKADLDRDGGVDYGEFLAATLHLARLERDERLYKAFRHFDTDGSGYITRDDLMSGLKHLGHVNVDRILADVDMDGDGKICYEEFCDMLRTEPEAPEFFAALGAGDIASGWGETTDSGRLALVLPHPDSVNPTRNHSLANSRNASTTDRSSYASMGAVSIRRSLGGNLLFGESFATHTHHGASSMKDRSSRPSGTGQRNSHTGQRTLAPRVSMAGSKRFGSMRMAAALANYSSSSNSRGSAPSSSATAAAARAVACYPEPQSTVAVRSSSKGSGVSGAAHTVLEDVDEGTAEGNTTSTPSTPACTSPRASKTGVAWADEATISSNDVVRTPSRTIGSRAGVGGHSIRVRRASHGANPPAVHPRGSNDNKPGVDIVAWQIQQQIAERLQQEASQDRDTADRWRQQQPDADRLSKPLHPLPSEAYKPDTLAVQAAVAAHAAALATEAAALAQASSLSRA